MTAKQALIEIAHSLNDENDWEEAEYQLYLRRKLEQAEEDVRQGRVFTNDEARDHLRRCREK
jgi:hypothetical protein